MIKAANNQIYFKHRRIISPDTFLQRLPFKHCEKAFKYTHELPNAIRKLNAGSAFNFKYFDSMAIYSKTFSSFYLIDSPITSLDEFSTFLYCLVSEVKKGRQDVINCLNHYLLKFISMAVENYKFEVILTQEFEIFQHLGIAQLFRDMPQYVCKELPVFVPQIRSLLNTYGQIPITALPQKLLALTDMKHVTELDVEGLEQDKKILVLNFSSKNGAGFVANQLRKLGFTQTVGVGFF